MRNQRLTDGRIHPQMHAVSAAGNPCAHARSALVRLKLGKAVTAVLDLLGQTHFVRKRKLVFSRQHGITKALKGIVGDSTVLFGTKN